MGGGKEEETLSQRTAHQPDLCLAAALPASPARAPPPWSPSLGGAEEHRAQHLTSAGLPGTVRSTYVEVSGRHPRDADGLGLAALHNTLGGLDGEALVLQECDAVQAELDGLRAWEPLATQAKLGPQGHWVPGPSHPLGPHLGAAKLHGLGLPRQGGG